MLRKKFSRIAELTVLVALLGACSSGGGSGSQTIFSVGGTVTGLPTGLTFTLQNNGQDDLVVNTNGGFTFSTLLQGGGGYWQYHPSLVSGAMPMYRDIAPPNMRLWA